MLAFHTWGICSENLAVPCVQMVRALHKRFIKRSLELIGAVAVVYLMLEVLESHSSEHNDRMMARVRNIHSLDSLFITVIDKK